MSVEAVLLTGRLGAGKTTIAVALGSLLDDAGVPYAVIDLDWLCWVGPDVTGGRLLALLADTLAGVVTRMRAIGVERFVLARAVADDHEVARLAAAVGTIRVVEIDVDAAVAGRRLSDRVSAAEDVTEAALFGDTRPVADFVVRNDGDRTPTEVAGEVLSLLGWTPVDRTVSADGQGQ